jgi:hypothetical protein
MTNKKDNSNCKKTGLVNSYIPIHRDETAMDGAPGRLWLIENTTARTTADPYGMPNKRTGSKRQ